MCPVTFAALIGVMSGCAVEGPSRLLDPANPSLSTHWRPPPSPTAGLETYKPVAARDWLQQNSAPGGGSAMGGMKNMPGMKSMPGMKGMSGGMKGMGGMPGMGSGK